MKSKKSKQTESETTTKEALKLELSFDDSKSEDFLRTIFINGKSIKDIVIDDENDPDGTKVMTTVSDILTLVSEKNDGMSPDLVNQYLLDNSEKYNLKEILVTATMVGKLAVEKSDLMTQITLLIRLKDYKTLDEGVKSFYETIEEELNEKKLRENEKELLTLNYIGVIVETI